MCPVELIDVSCDVDSDDPFCLIRITNQVVIVVFIVQTSSSPRHMWFFDQWSISDGKSVFMINHCPKV